MKIQSNKTTDFAPRSITITFESQSELDTFGAVFNFVPTCEVIDALGLDSEKIREQVNLLGGSCGTDRFREISSRIKSWVKNQ